MMSPRLRVTALRLERDWSKLELSRRAKIDPSSIGRLERGWNTLYPKQLVRVARALGLPAAEAESLLASPSRSTPPPETS